MEDSLEFLAEANCSNNHFIIDDLFNFPQEDNKAMSEGLFFEPVNKGGNSADSSTAVDSCNSSVSGGDTTQFNGNLSGRSFTDVQFPDGELCVPYDDLAELEWLSNFVEESFSSDDMNNLQFIPTITTPPSATTPAASIGASSSSATLISDDNLNQPSLPMFSPEVSVPGKARSKRSRTAPCDWSSRLLHLYQSPATSPARNNPPKNINCNSTGVNTLVIGNYNNNHLNLARKQRRLITDTPGRKCLHCASEKTPQWRTGPLGPKTLCNACGVRYKSGRLVPEYRPASSPTFVPAKHSNSHRKVLEMRRQKETQIEQPLLTQNDIFGLSDGGDGYLIHQPLLMNGHDFSQMIA